MHLLASRPGGYQEDEGIIDLDQVPSDIVILSASDGFLSALAVQIDGMPEDFPSCCLANWQNLTKPAALDLYLDKTLSAAKLVVVFLLGGRDHWAYGVEQLLAWQGEDKNRQLFLLSGEDQLDSHVFSQTSESETAEQLWAYHREAGAGNLQALMELLANQLKGKNLYDVPAPVSIPNVFCLEGDDLKIVSLDAQAVTDKTVAVLLYKRHVQTEQLTVFQALKTAYQALGCQVVLIAVSSMKDPEVTRRLAQFFHRNSLELVVNTTSFAWSDMSRSQSLSNLTSDTPIIQTLMLSSDREDWRESTLGVRPRDLAMQTVLPEMDGKVLAGLISFKAVERTMTKVQHDAIEHDVDVEEVSFVARVGHRMAQLRRKPNSQKKIGIVLANYPTKDGRIGNGVGLDTPQSALTILNALNASGYQLSSVPDSTQSLMADLQAGVTNDSTAWHRKHCWQSLSLEDYQAWFQRLPAVSQSAVTERWGAPEQDPKCRHGRLMISGIRLGNVFIGIQPARGYDLDLQATYHDPDLVPPHSYLAFYCWLRNVYQVDALVQLGKHGTLEWLPGKSVALSDACWPRGIVDDMPTFYPFIVNDPGEGTQAKRRTHAVILDHLMPPLAQAGLYDELAELEVYVDELYQASGLDLEREAWLKDTVLDHLKSHHLDQEIQGIDWADQDKSLSALDAFLCEIKEAQIRNGLHVFGELPENSILAETLLSLVRLPRGAASFEKGVLEAVVEDFQLCTSEGALLDLHQDQVWLGQWPAPLKAFSNTQDNRVSQLKAAIERWVLFLIKADQSQFEHCLAEGTPNTKTVLAFARNALSDLLKTSVEHEVQHLLDGLSGRFVPAGPSGAPSRGRLDVLPTGRNFYSLDSRNIPTKAAWALGQKSAQALIERHLQEKGEFPVNLGLSVWGTSTMRTGGDDIAQAFALMGVEPIWNQAGNRVVDIQAIPVMLLGRPRVDVTLRVSGFFRDAFPNVMRLFDAAVQAVIDFPEGGADNPIRANSHKQSQALQAQGLSKENAQRQASYRVFGSKPGAYGAGLKGLIDERCWETSEDLAQAYLNWGGYAYGASKESQQGVKASNAFEHQLSQIEAVVQNQDNREHDVLDSDDYYQFQGGMSNAVSVLSGQQPMVYHMDHANPSLPKAKTLKEELNKVLRSRMLNPKWITAMRRHGYKGASEMSASLDYLFAYDATTQLVENYQYDQVTERLLLCPENQAFLQEHNPKAMEEMAERLLEAHQRGMWQSVHAHEQKVQSLLLDMDAEQEGVS